MLFQVVFGPDLRSRKEGGDHLKNVRLALGGIIESRCINQNGTTTFQLERCHNFCGVCARLNLPADVEIGSADISMDMTNLFTILGASNGYNRTRFHSRFVKVKH